LIDATVLTGAIIDRAKASGMNILLLDLGDLDDSFPTVSLMTTKNFQASKRKLVRAFRQGIGEAIHVFKSDLAAGQRSLSKWLRSQDKATLDSADKSYAPRISFPPYTEWAGGQVAVDVKGKKAQEFVNEELLRELDQQGFFKSLQKK